MIVQLGDAPPHDPEPVTGLTADRVVEAAFAVDPAQVYVIDVSSGGSSAGPLADVASRTGGALLRAPSPSEVSAALADALGKALRKPYAWAGGPYVTTIGKELTLDASGSYDPDGRIVSYEWDFDGDGTYDQRTADPMVSHTFDRAFDGEIVLRVTDDSGTTGLATARAHASADGDEVPDAVDNCPAAHDPGQADTDGDGVGDVCDPSPGYPTKDREGIIVVDDSGGSDTCQDRAVTIRGTPGADVLSGTPGDDVIHGDGGNDRIIGRGGHDVICGGPGNDRLEGGTGDDVLLGDEGDDVLLGNQGDDLLLGGDGNDRLEGGLDKDRLEGGAGDDLLLGNQGDDLLLGGDGNDRLEGGPGDDRLEGGAGDDLLLGNQGDDRCTASRTARFAGCEVALGPGLSPTGPPG